MTLTLNMSTEPIQLRCHKCLALADLGEACLAHPPPPPHGTQFFRFRIHFHRKRPMSEVHAPPNGCTPPYGKSWIRHCLVSAHSTIEIVMTHKSANAFAIAIANTIVSVNEALHGYNCLICCFSDTQSRPAHLHCTLFTEWTLPRASHYTRFIYYFPLCVQYASHMLHSQ